MGYDCMTILNFCLPTYLLATRAGAGGLLSPREWPGVPLEVEEKGECHCLVLVGYHGIVYCTSVGTLQMRI